MIYSSCTWASHSLFEYWHGVDLSRRMISVKCKNWMILKCHRAVGGEIMLSFPAKLSINPFSKAMLKSANFFVKTKLIGFFVVCAYNFLIPCPYNQRLLQNGFCLKRWFSFKPRDNNFAFSSFFPAGSLSVDFLGSWFLLAFGLILIADFAPAIINFEVGFCFNLSLS